MSDSLSSRVYWLPISLFICLFLLFSAAGVYLYTEDREVRLQKATSVAAQTKAYLQAFSNEREQALINLMKSWPSFEPNINDWFNAQAQRLTSMQQGYSSLIYANQDRQISWVYTPQNQVARSRLSVDYIDASLATTGLEISQSNDEFTHSIIQSDSSGSPIYYLVIGRAISPQEAEHGYLVASYNLNNILMALLGDLINPEVDEENQFAMSLIDRGDSDTVLLNNGEVDANNSTVVTTDVSFIQRSFQLSVQTRAGNPLLGFIVTLVGCLMSVLICLFLHKQLKGAVALHNSQKRFQMASDAALDALMIYQPSKRDFDLIEANQYAAQLFDASTFYSRQTLREQLAYLDQLQFIDAVKQVLATGKPHEEYLRINNDAVKAKWVKVQVVRAGKDIALTVRDVTARFEAKLALQESEEKYRRLVDGLHRHFVYIKTPEHTFEYVSAGIEEIFDLSLQEFVEYEASMRHILSDEAQVERSTVSQGIHSRPYTIEYMAKESGAFVIEYSDTCVFDEHGTLVAIEGIARDVTQEHELQRKVTFQANHDQLTGLYNRYAFDRKLKQLLLEVSEHDETAVMCFIDMDRFKLVNDTCGHPAGDRLLKEIAQLFSQHVSDVDTLARIGGDEFCIIFRNTSIDKTKPVLDELLHDISTYRFIYEEQVFFVGASIGVIQIDQHHMDAAQLIKAADNACYQAKYHGRNRYHIYEATEAQIEVSQVEASTLSWLQKAIGGEGFVLHCQRILPLNKHTNGVHYEILLRLQNPSGDLVSPAVFLPLAERHGLMNKIDMWVVDNTLTLLEQASEHVATLDKVAINLSGLTLVDSTMLRNIVQRVVQSNIPPSKLCFEITETEAVTNLNMAQHFISTLRELGCRFALDDFGAGMSSFTYLKHLDVDYVKIDGSFVRNMTKDNIDFATVKAINNIAHSMGKETVAEFVVDAATTEVLKTLKVDYGQGYALGKPVPLVDVLGNTEALTTV